MKSILVLIAIVLSLLAPALFTGTGVTCATMDPNYLLSCD
jgi:hypothetical protein